MGIRLSAHARQRALERGLPNCQLQKLMRSVRLDGFHELPSGHALYVQDGVVVTVLAPGMTRDTRL